MKSEDFVGFFLDKSKPAASASIFSWTGLILHTLQGVLG
jgi:hypothetical protein